MLKEKRFSLSIKVELAKKLEIERKFFSNEIDQIELSTQSNSRDIRLTLTHTCSLSFLWKHMV